MPLVSLNNESIYGWISRISCVIVFFVTSITLALHLKDILNQLKTKKTILTNSLIFSVILQIFILLLSIGWIWNSWTIIKNKQLCEINLHISIIAYISVKWSLYMFLSFRLGL